MKDTGDLVFSNGKTLENFLVVNKVGDREAVEPVGLEIEEGNCDGWEGLLSQMSLRPGWSFKMMDSRHQQGGVSLMLVKVGSISLGKGASPCWQAPVGSLLVIISPF